MSDVDAPFALPLGDTLDLHAFLPREVRSVVIEYLTADRTAGLTEVRLIHGRGRGVQRAAVLTLLARIPWVLAAHEATPDRGGWGATVVQLAPDGSPVTSPPG